jgi:hypothetical protein
MSYFILIYICKVCVLGHDKFSIHVGTTHDKETIHGNKHITHIACLVYSMLGHSK